MADKETKFLQDWTIRYVKNRDLITRKIVSVNEKEGSFIIARSDKEQKFFIIPFLKDINALVGEVKDYEHFKTVVCFHTKSNFEFMIKNWGAFIDLGRTFTIYFVNPFSKLEKVLSLSPHTHNLVSDNDSLELGLKTMAENVEFTTEEEVNKIINS